jgi:outer membrane protein TolC
MKKLIIGILLLPLASLHAQFKDSLSLPAIIQEVTQNHPAVKAAGEALRKADARVGLAQTGYLPDVDVSANYSNVGPVPELTFEPMGTFKLFPNNNYSATLNVRQTIYDFGRTKTTIETEKLNKTMDLQALEQVRQKIAQAAIAGFYSLCYLQEAVKIKKEQLKVLDEHLAFVQKKKETGSATDYEILATQVKASIVESQLMDLEAALTIQQSAMNTLLGLPVGNPLLVKGAIDQEKPVNAGDTLFTSAFANRSEMIMGRKKEDLATLRLLAVRDQNRPVISFVFNGGAKNGYMPNLNKIKPNYAVGAGIRVPIFDANRTKFNVLQAESSIKSTQLEIEQTGRVITGEIVESETNMKTASRKIQLFELQLSQAKRAYALAEINFRAGAITNLDLLDAENSVSDSRLMLVKARIDLAVCNYRFLAAIGKKFY